MSRPALSPNRAGGSGNRYIERLRRAHLHTNGVTAQLKTEGGGWPRLCTNAVVFCSFGCPCSVCERGAFADGEEARTIEQVPLHPNTDTIMSQLKIEGCRILCAFCKECEYFFLAHRLKSKTIAVHVATGTDLPKFVGSVQLRSNSRAR